MAFFLTPRFAPAYQQCGPFACGPARQSYSAPRPARQSFPSFVPFLGQLDELFGEIDREARRAAHQERQQRKRAFRARFDVRENQNVYEVEGEVPGFEQENISIEVTDEYTLKVAGNTQQKEEDTPASINKTTSAEPEANETNDKMDGITLNEAEVDEAGSDTESHKSHQPTVEDDFEDLTAETSSLISNTSTATASTSEPKEPKRKEKAVAASATEQNSVETQQLHNENREWLSERVHGSFERTFQFPERIDAANVKASLKNGILAISVPKAPAPQIRQVLIQ